MSSRPASDAPVEGGDAATAAPQAAFLRDVRVNLQLVPKNADASIQFTVVRGYRQIGEPVVHEELGCRSIINSGNRSTERSPVNRSRRVGAEWEMQGAPCGLRLNLQTPNERAAASGVNK